MEDIHIWTILLLMVLGLFLVWPRGSGEQAVLPSAPQASISFAPLPAREGEALNVRVELPDSCANLSGLALSFDNQSVPLARSGAGFEAVLRPSAGAHRVQLEGGQNCRAAAGFSALPKPCPEGRNRSCTDARGCAGISQCIGGAWGACRSPPRICDAGASTPC
ncbi:MAG: hypothetical protein M1530_00020, partial [Candidatus Marsarchaeota archaeon]|nr:hypothetical protein [Candidatus Marsarchaeota archaeon]